MVDLVVLAIPLTGNYLIVLSLFSVTVIFLKGPNCLIVGFRAYHVIELVV